METQAINPDPISSQPPQNLLNMFQAQAYNPHKSPVDMAEVKMHSVH